MVVGETQGWGSDGAGRRVARRRRCAHGGNIWVVPWPEVAIPGEVSEVVGK
jgi:hypothetical protein